MHHRQHPYCLWQSRSYISFPTRQRWLTYDRAYSDDALNQLHHHPRYVLAPTCTRRMRRFVNNYSLLPNYQLSYLPMADDRTKQIAGYINSMCTTQQLPALQRSHPQSRSPTPLQLAAAVAPSSVVLPPPWPCSCSHCAATTTYSPSIHTVRPPAVRRSTNMRGRSEGRRYDTRYDASGVHTAHHKPAADLIHVLPADGQSSSCSLVYILLPTNKPWLSCFLALHPSTDVRIVFLELVWLSVCF